MTFEEELISKMGLIMTYAMKLCRGNRTRAEDLVQDTMVNALKYQDKYTRGTAIGAWLIMIMKNLHYSAFRVSNRYVEDVDGMYSKNQCAAGDPYTHLEEKQELDRVRALPPKFGDVLLMVADGMTHTEIAAEMHVASGTVRSRIFRGRAALQGMGVLLAAIVLISNAYAGETTVGKKQASTFPMGYSCITIQRIVNVLGVQGALAAARVDGWTATQIAEASKCAGVR